MRNLELGEEMGSLHIWPQGKEFQSELRWKMTWRIKKFESGSECCWQIRKLIEESGRAGGSIGPQIQYNWSGTIFFLKMDLISPSHTSVWGECLCIGPQESAYCYRPHLKPKDAQFPHKCLTKIIPPAIAMQKAKNCSWDYTTHGTYACLKRTLSKMFIKSRANYWLYHKKVFISPDVCGFRLEWQIISKHEYVYYWFSSW